MGVFCFPFQTQYKISLTRVLGTKWWNDILNDLKNLYYKVLE